MRRASDWLKQARSSLNLARYSMKGEYYWAACFFAQQAAEYAVKGLLASLGKEARGHSIYELLVEARGFNVSVSNELLSKARSLDRHYLHARYPNLYYVGAPMDYYTREDSEKALGEAEEIVRFCEKRVGEG